MLPHPPLVQGPPGSGKTMTACALVSAWLRCGMGPILATADSNTAVDTLVEGLHRRGLNGVRCARQERSGVCEAENHPRDVYSFTRIRSFAGSAAANPFVPSFCTCPWSHWQVRVCRAAR